MEANENDMNEMQHLANVGWKQMHEMLREHDLSVDPSAVEADSKRRILFPVMAASVLFILIFSFPYILNDKFIVHLNTPSSNTNNPSVAKTPVTITQSVTMISRVPASAVFSPQQVSLSKKTNVVMVDARKEIFKVSLYPKNDNFEKEAAKEMDPVKTLERTIAPAAYRFDRNKFRQSRKRKKSTKPTQNEFIFMPAAELIYQPGVPILNFLAPGI